MKILKMKSISVVAAATMLVACGGAETGGGTAGVGSEPFINASPDLTAAEVNAFRSRHGSIGRSSPNWPYVFLPPAGTATYAGAFVFDDVTINGDNSGDGGRHGLAGRARFEVDFRDRNGFEGTFFGVNRMEGGEPVERLDGTLSASAVNSRTGSQTFSSGQIDGQLSGGFGTTERQVVDLDLTFTGSARRPNSTPILAGPDQNLRYVYSDDVAGSGVGGVDVEIQNGRFYGER